MDHADVGIVGGGLAGSLAAAILGNAGISTVLIDVHEPYPEDFRCEKIEEKHFTLLRQTGLIDQIKSAATLFTELWIARRGYLIDKRPNEQYGLAYPDFVNAARAQIPPAVRFVRGRATNLATSPTRQTITMASGEEISVRLLILATGNNNDTSRKQVNITRRDIRKCQSVSIGFYLKPKDRDAFRFIALTYFSEKPKDQIAYISLFPLRGMMRANIFLYRDMRDPWLAAMRQTTPAALYEAMPRLKRLLGDFEVVGDVVIRPIDLYATEGYRQPGVVLAGDSFSTSCPAAGTGVVKALNDVVRLCNVHIPRWLATEGMGAEKISAYYDDPEKTHVDAYSEHLAFYMRSLTLDRGLRWRVRRIGWFGLESCRSILRPLHHRVRRQTVKSIQEQGLASETIVAGHS